MKKLNSNAIRQQNLHAIFDILQQGTMTRQDIARSAKLSLMSVTNLIDQLQENQAVVVNPASQEDGVRRIGRKAETISLDVSRDLWMVINLTDRCFRYVTLRADRRITHASAPFAYDAELSYRENLGRFLQTCAGYSRERMPELSGVAVALPGPFDAELDQVSNMRIPEMNRLHIREMLTEAFGDVYAYLDEDVKFAVRAYAGIYPEQRSLYYLYIGEGIGGALSYNGQVLYGLNSIMGDPGQLRPDSGETFEQELSLRAFLRNFAGDGAEALNGNTAEVIDALFTGRKEEYLQALEGAAEGVAKILRLAAWMLDPHAVVIDCVYVPADLQQRFAQAVLSKLSAYGDLRRLPEICPLQINIDAPYFGAVKALEKHWIAMMK